MAAEASAYTVLGLEPGADWAAVEHAYKTLMKVHHPDRAGGDSSRAAEINQAFRELRRARAFAHEDTWGEGAPTADERAPQRHWLAAALSLAAVAALVVVFVNPTSGLIDDFRMRAAPLVAAPARTAVHQANDDVMDAPLTANAIQASVAEALRAVAIGNDAALSDASRKCNAEQRLHPSLTQLDRCAAFDDAIVQLQDRDPWRDDGPFSQVSITGRQTSAANMLSDDYLAIDGRLDRIRMAVEVALARSDPVPQPPANSAS